MSQFVVRILKLERRPRARVNHPPAVRAPFPLRLFVAEVFAPHLRQHRRRLVPIAPFSKPRFIGVVHFRKLAHLARPISVRHAAERRASSFLCAAALVGYGRALIGRFGLPFRSSLHRFSGLGLRITGTEIYTTVRRIERKRSRILITFQTRQKMHDKRRQTSHPKKGP